MLSNQHLAVPGHPARGRGTRAKPPRTFGRILRNWKTFVWLLGVMGVLQPAISGGAPIGVVTAVFYERTGTGVFLGEGGAASVLPDQGFAIPDFGSGAFGAAAHAAFLDLGTNAFTTGIASNECECVGVGAVVRAYAVAQNVLTPGGGVVGQPGFLAITLDVSGTNSAVVSGTELLAVSSRSVLNVAAVTAALAGPVTITTPGAYYFLAQSVFGALLYDHVPVRIDVPITYGTPLAVWMELISITEGSVTTGDFRATNDFSHTVKIASVELLDASRQPLANPSLVAESETIYPLVGGAGEPPPAVPGPGTLVLLGTGVVGLLMRQFVRKVGQSRLAPLG